MKKLLILVALALAVATVSTVEISILSQPALADPGSGGCTSC